MTTHAERPFFTVVVPTYNREHSLTACLAALAEQDFPRHRFEVIVVNDGGSSPVSATVATFTGQMNARVIEQSNAGPATARNSGATAARGEYLAFTDDDCRPDRTWLRALEATLHKHPGSAAGGRVVNAIGDSVFSASSQLLIEFLYTYYNTEQQSARFFITSNIALPTSQFHECGGFDVTFPLAAAEDRDLCDRWLESGNSMAYAENAVVYHAHALKIRSFCRQHWNYGRGALHLHRARARRGVDKLRVEPFRFYRELLLFPFRRATGVRKFTLPALAALSQVAYVAGYLRERMMVGAANATVSNLRPVR